MKIVNLLFAVIFVVFAFVQINDPDPVIWIVIYGSLAVSCVMAAFGYYYPKIMIAMLILLASYSLTFFSGMMEWLRQDDKAMLFDNLAKMEHPYIEESREFLGLFICISVLLMHLIRSKIVHRNNFT